MPTLPVRPRGPGKVVAELPIEDASMSFFRNRWKINLITSKCPRESIMITGTKTEWLDFVRHLTRQLDIEADDLFYV